MTAKKYEKLNKKAAKAVVFSKLGRVVYSRYAAFYEYHKDLFTRLEDDSLFKKLKHENRSLEPNSFNGKTSYVLSDRSISESTRNLGKLIRSISEVPTSKISDSVFYTYFNCDSDAIPHLKTIRTNGGIYVPHMDSSKTEYRFVNKNALKAMQKTWNKKARLSYLSAVTHENICEALEITRRVEGVYIEIGVYLGASAITALNYIQETGSHDGLSESRGVYLLDTFNGFDYAESDQSADAIWAGTHKLFGVDRTMEYIKTTMADVTVPFKMVCANILDENAVPKEITKIAVANIDVDMYEPTLVALQKVSDLMSLGGIIIAEDPASTPALYGALLAMEEFLASPRGSKFVRIFKRGQYFLLKIK